MSEHTDKASQKPRKAPAGKRAPRKARPSSTRSAGPSRKAGNDKTQEEPTKSAPAKPAPPKAETPDDKTANDSARSLAPDPATVVFGSNRPIVAPPPPKPASSGLRFSGPSDGVLKSTGPQATSPKAEGLTFSNAGPNPGSEAGSSTGPDAAETKPATAKTGKASTAKSKKAKDGKAGGAKTKPGPAKGKSKPAPGATTPAVKAETGKAKTPGKTGAVTKPAIAPQNHGPLIEKEPSRGPLVLIALGIMTVALVWWLANQPPSQMAGSERDTAGEASSGAGPLPGSSADTTDTAPAQAVPEQAVPEQAGALITVAELREVRDLLGTIGLDAGAHSDEMTETTRAAIRDYQTMAGLPVDGEATPALLEELRSVAALYGG